MRTLGQQNPILEGAGLAFIGIADHETPLARLGGREPPFAARRETGSATAAQTAGLDHVDNDLWRERDSFRQTRLGPDLRNVGSRLGDAKPAEYAEWFYRLLYAPQSVAKGTNMPAHPFLFDVHPVAGRQPSAHALALPSKFAPGPGLEVVPTSRAVALVAYLQSLKDTYDYPIERSRNTPAPKKGGH